MMLLSWLRDRSLAPQKHWKMLLVVALAIVSAAVTSWYLGSHIGVNTRRVEGTVARVASQQDVVSAVAQVELRNCIQIERVKAIIRGVIVAQAQSLGRPGSAGYGYYLTHGEELAQARRVARMQAAQFAPLSC